MLIKVVKNWQEIRPAFEDDADVVICEDADFRAKWDEDLCIVITMPAFGRAAKESLKSLPGCEITPYSIQLLPRFVALGTVPVIRSMLSTIKKV